jgi:hypothetical protein
MIRQAVAHFVLQVVIGIALVAVVAALWDLLFGGGLRYSLAVALFIVGGFAILLGGLGLAGGSPTQRTLDTARIPGLPAFTRSSEGTEINASVLLLLTGAMLIAIGFCV